MGGAQSKQGEQKIFPCYQASSSHSGGSKFIAAFPALYELECTASDALSPPGGNIPKPFWRTMGAVLQNNLESEIIDATSTESVTMAAKYMSDEKQKTDLDAEVEAVSAKLEEAQSRNRKLKTIAKNLEAIAKLEEENVKLTKENEVALRRKF